MGSHPNYPDSISAETHVNHWWCQEWYTVKTAAMLEKVSPAGGHD